VPLARIQEESDDVLARRDLPVRQHEEIVRVDVLGLAWDIGAMIHEPAEVVSGADGRKVGIFLLHGGDGDFTEMEPIARLYSRKFGHKVVSMTYPGRLYFDDPDHRWPGDTINADGSVRTPIWQRGEVIGRDQYDVVRDASLRLRYGTRTVARARAGTRFFDRMPPNVLFAIAKYSRDHSREVYREVILPMFAELERAPRVALSSFDAGTHFYFRPEPGLPLGIGPSVAKLFHEAITGGYFIQ
jgi:hypothetical protein